MGVKEIKEILKNVLKEGRPNASGKKKLKEIGFSIERNSGHYKLFYYGKSRVHMFTLSFSPSDKRGGLNLVSDIIRDIEGDLA